MEGSKMQCSKSIVTSAMSVDPGSQLFGLKPLYLLSDISSVSTTAVEQSCILFLLLA